MYTEYILAIANKCLAAHTIIPGTIRVQRPSLTTHYFTATHTYPPAPPPNHPPPFPTTKFLVRLSIAPTSYMRHRTRLASGLTKSRVASFGKTALSLKLDAS